MDVNGGPESTSITKNRLVLPEIVHGLDCYIYVGDKCIDKSLVTIKNMLNPVDVSGSSLLSQAKEVEKNCKKAFAFCLAEDSLYKSFKGTFPSGQNRNDYMVCIKKN